MTEISGIDWEDAFSNSAYIANGDAYPAAWTTSAQAFRDRASTSNLDIPYGKGERERLDLFLPDREPAGLVIFVHGGYWLAFDKSTWSHLAAGALPNGWAVALPSYTLAPVATLPEITAQIGRAITKAASIVPGPIRLVGHSAGGHLVTRMICDDSPLTPDVAERIEHVVSISGLHDLRPLRLHSMNDKLGLTEDTALRESAALHHPRAGARLTVWVGGGERPEFLRQSALLAERWSRLGADATLVVDPGRHHFDVIDGLQDAGSPLTRTLLRGIA